jgi:UDP-N-acetylmuramoyl-tripeptide--D-alanyl-D-alanine ligase
MSRLSLSALAELADGRLFGTDADFDGVSSDTRTVRPGQLFVALQGPRFDGHDYLDEAAAKGAVGALVHRETDASIGQVVVDDTRLGFGRLARGWRRRCPARVIGLTGSNGKTTLKEMIAAILAANGPTLATLGNLNNDIGVPHTLCRLRDQRFAVIEMGANHAGEIDYLTRLVEPEIAILNNAGRAHLEGFGSLEGVAHAKAEIINGLAPDGLFVLNADDRFAPLWRELSKGHRVCSFGVREPADVSSPRDGYVTEWLESHFEARFPVDTPAGGLSVGLRLAGEHNRMNALAAIAAALEAGAAPQSIAPALQSIAPVPGRLCPLAGPGGSRLVDDSYNANPDSVLAALRVLMTAPGRRTLVLGDLAELGGQARDLHRGIGEQATGMGVDRLLTIGQLSGAAGDGFAGEHRHYADVTRLIDDLATTLGGDDSVLIKGSRSARLDEVVAALAPQEDAC